jgi:hypothetical protein
LLMTTWLGQSDAPKNGKPCSMQHLSRQVEIASCSDLKPLTGEVVFEKMRTLREKMSFALFVCMFGKCGWRMGNSMNSSSRPCVGPLAGLSRRVSLCLFRQHLLPLEVRFISKYGLGNHPCFLSPPESPRKSLPGEHPAQYSRHQSLRVLLAGRSREARGAEGIER